MSVTAQYVFAFISAVANILLIFGLYFAFMQVRSAKLALKAQVLLKLIDEWKDPKLYKAMIYLSRLRESWKDVPTDEWPNLAKHWVETHAGKSANSADTAESALWEEWEMRRIAAQFLSKTGTLIDLGYLSEDEFFSVDPEAGRQLVVLIYIEKAILDHYSDRNSIADWDHPFPKFEFNTLWPRYQRWYKKHGVAKSVLALPDLSSRATALPIQPTDTTTPTPHHAARQ